MNSTCPNCGKVLKVKDEWAGKMLKCPGCAKTFKIGGGSAAAPAAGVTRKIDKPTGTAKPGAAPPKPVRNAQPQKAGIAINWGVISLIAGLSLIPIGIALFLLGPRSAIKHWDAHSAKAQDDVTTIIEYAIKCEASHAGTWNPNKSVGGTPSVVDLNFHPDFMTMSTPTKVHFVGTTSNGKFEGDYAYDSTEIVATLTIGGITLGGVHIDSEGVTMPGGQTEKHAPKLPGLPGGGGAANGNVGHALTGRIVANVGPQIELDGKRLDIFYPPKLDEDGNRIP